MQVMSCLLLVTTACRKGERPVTIPWSKIDNATVVSSRTDVTTSTCAEERRRFVTAVDGAPHDRDRSRPPKPPDTKLARVKYRSLLGEMWAYVTPDPGDGRRHPAVVWAHGGFDFSIGDLAFEHGPPDNDQSGRGFLDAGLIVMYPSYRGNHDNPGHYEMLYGEVDDYLAAVEYVRGLPYVDPERVYLAGHSTGGTIVLLAAALSDGYRAAFALGPVGWVQDYGETPPFDPEGPQAETEWRLRSPAACIGEIRRPTLIIEGEDGNADDARALGNTARQAGAPVQVSIIEGRDHFDIIAPAIARIAELIAADTGREWGEKGTAQRAEQVEPGSGREPGTGDVTHAAADADLGGDLNANVIRRIIRTKLPEILLCYERVLERLPDLSGTVVVVFDIEADGKAVRARAEGVHEEVAACVAGVTQTLQFPPPKSEGMVRVRYPFSFRPAE
jgi:acetyl esterase/lipase